MDVKETVVGGGFALEEGGGDLFAGDDAAGGAHEHFEQVEFHAGELDGLAGSVRFAIGLDPGFARGGVEADVAEGEIGKLRGGNEAVAAQDGADAGEQLVRIEGFGEIVVSSGIEAEDAVLRLDAGGEHDDGDSFAAAELLEDFDAVQNGEHDVEDDEIVGAVEGVGEAVAAVVDEFDAVAGLGEEFGHHGAELFVVINEQEREGGLFFGVVHFRTAGSALPACLTLHQVLHNCAGLRLRKEDGVMGCGVRRWVRRVSGMQGFAKGFLRLAGRVAAALLVFSLAASAATAKSGVPVVVGYVFPQNTVLQPGEIDARALTRINFAFARIRDGRMETMFAQDAENLAMLTALRRKNPSLTVLVSVGGWLGSGGFSDAALTKTSRRKFIDSVMEFLKRYDLDGLDVDWEYPGLVGSGHKFRAADKRNFTLLLAELRQRFDAEKQQGGRRLYLTIAAGATQDFLDHTEMARVARLVDTVNLMSYDYYEPDDDRMTGHHAPLFTNPDDPKKVSADNSVKAFEQAGVPAGKIVLGVPFYGHEWGDVSDRAHGLYQRGKKIPGDYAPYSVIASTMLGHGFTRYWDATSSVPYLYNAEKRIFVSYEDPESIAAKGHYVLAHGLRGIMFWDYESDPSGTLLHAVDASLGLDEAQ